MAEQEVENKQTAGAAPAVAEKPAAGAPETTPTEKPTQAKPEQTPAEKIQFFAKRKDEEAKKLAAENETLRKELESARQAKESTPAETEADDFGILEDPKKAVKKMRESVKNEILAELQGREQEKQHKSAAESARQWLLSQSHINEDPKFADSVVGNIQNKYMDVAGVNPQAAARLAYEDACRDFGITPGQSDGQSSAGVRPSAPQVGGKRVFSRAEIADYVYGAHPGSTEYSRRVDEVEEARREGRIR